MTYHDGGRNVIYAKGVTEKGAKTIPSAWLGLAQLLLTLAILIALVYGFLAILQASAPRDVTVPKIEGLDQPAAEILLKNAGLTYEIGGRRPSDTVAEGKVIEATPHPGHRVKEGRRVSLIVSAGSRWTTVPDIREMSERRARSVLQQKSLFLGQTRQIYHARVPKDFVVAQIPSPGTRAPADSEVQAVISRGTRSAGSVAASAGAQTGDNSNSREVRPAPDNQDNDTAQDDTSPN